MGQARARPTGGDPLRAVLLIADLEGVAGVDEIGDLFAFSPDFPRARELLTAELQAALRGLHARGVTRVAISDSHRPGGGAPTVLADRLGHDGLEVSVVGGEDDAYAAALMEGMDAVACLGMHAAAGTAGFAAHTVSVTCAIEQDGLRLSETDLVMALAAERGLPALFVTGDDVLERAVSGPAFVTTKTAISPAASRSRPALEVHAAIEEAARTARPVACARRRGALTVSFKSHWMAAQAGAVPAGPHAVRVEGATFAEAYAEAVRTIGASDPTLASALRAGDASLLADDLTTLLLRRFPTGRPVPRPGAAVGALDWFLEATAPTPGVPAPATRAADRALVLSMLEGHAPRFFEVEGIAAHLEAAVGDLSAIPAAFPRGLPPAEGMARLDALYVSSVHGAPRPFDAREACAYAGWLASAAPVIWAWLFIEILALLGVERPLRIPPRAMRDERTADLYWLTHLVLLETRYLRSPPTPGRLDATIEALLLATPEVIAGRQIDVAAEIALCLQATGEAQTAEHRALLDLLCAHQVAGGRVVDPSAEGAGDPVEEARLAAHATGAALVALAYAT